MSKDYCKENGIEGYPTTDPEMRKWCQRPGKHDEDGNPVYFTEQAHKKECEIDHILKKFDKTGLITHIQDIEAKFGDVTGMEFQNMQNKIAAAKNSFNQLPLDIRNRFENDPAKLLSFMDDENNRHEAIKLGLIHEDTPENLDGLGEHVTADQAVNPTTGQPKDEPK